MLLSKDKMTGQARLPENVHVSNHPCLQAKLSQLRSKSTNARDVKALINEISLILGCEALAKGLAVTPGPTVCCTFINYCPTRTSLMLDL